jgi:hypothetical protein
MSFVHPFALLLLLPALSLVAWLTLWRGQAVMRLPGHWHRIIDMTMQSFMAKQVVSQNRLPLLFWLTIWTLMVLGLARPILDFGEPTAYGNLAGRVIALDIGAGIDVDRQRLIAYRIVDAAPTVPTALVVATAEAFDVVPLTTDRAHLGRYLQVIKPDVMPVSGRAPGIAIVHAESLLERADIVVGQLVLLTGGRVPAAEATTPGDWLRALVVDRDRVSDWEGYADRIGARLTDETSIQAVIDDLDNEVAHAIRDSDEAAEFALGPWLIAVAALLWLFFFRRVRSS